MNTRNPKSNAGNAIDMEIEHPVYGWIPFTASPDDVEELGRALHAAAIAGELGPVAAYVPPPAPTQAELDAAAQAAIDAELREIDLASIRSMREYLAALPDAPQYLKDHEATAAAKRAERPK